MHGTRCGDKRSFTVTGIIFFRFEGGQPSRARPARHAIPKFGCLPVYCFSAMSNFARQLQFVSAFPCLGNSHDQNAKRSIPLHPQPAGLAWQQRRRRRPPGDPLQQPAGGAEYGLRRNLERVCTTVNSRIQRQSGRTPPSEPIPQAAATRRHRTASNGSRAIRKPVASIGRKAICCDAGFGRTRRPAASPACQP